VKEFFSVMPIDVVSVCRGESLAGEMKAIVIDGAGGPEVLKLKEVDDPVAGAGEVVIKIVAAALNRADVMQRQGSYPPPPGASLIPGLECSGTIESVGHGVTHWKVGDEVLPANPKYQWPLLIF
jgi:NADPH:quinone reductase-like Zn-dependent oxidoreductase